MIGGIFFLASIIAVFIVFDWFRRNDTIPDNEPTTGLLAMNVPETEIRRKGPRPWTRDGALKR